MNTNHFHTTPSHYKWNPNNFQRVEHFLVQTCRIKLQMEPRISSAEVAVQFSHQRTEKRGGLSRISVLIVHGPVWNSAFQTRLSYKRVKAMWMARSIKRAQKKKKNPLSNFHYSKKSWCLWVWRWADQCWRVEVVGGGGGAKDCNDGEDRGEGRGWILWTVEFLRSRSTYRYISILFNPPPLSGDRWRGRRDVRALTWEMSGCKARWRNALPVRRCMTGEPRKLLRFIRARSVSPASSRRWN